MPDALCKHPRKRLIAKDDDSQYWECLDCGEILEAAELVNAMVNDLTAEAPPAQPSESPSPSQKPPGFDESLSDA